MKEEDMRKLASLLLAGVMLFMVGCSPDNATSTVEDSTGIVKDEAKVSETASSNGVVTLKMAMKDLSPSNEAHQAYIERIESGLAAKGVNVKLEVAEMPQGNYAENLGLKLLNGDIPDIIYFQGGDQAMADQGILEDLTPYIKKSTLIQNAMLPFQKKD